MWIKCRCGNIIHDNTDNISYKGHIISDREYFKMFDLADEMIESSWANREALAINFRTNISSKGYIKIKSIFQCTYCGRLLLEDENNQYCSFTPDEPEKKNLLDFNGNDTIEYRYK